MSFTLTELLTYVGIVAIIVTVLVEFMFKKNQSWLMSFMQSFCGVLFLFSGWVKAVDPLGTAYKMEQYFAEFEATFEGTWFSFLAPMFPALADYAIWFSVFMIVFEIVLGMMLLIGARPKWTSWAFFLLVLFFTFLTGFTYLTGYVPQDVNFFSFGDWGPYVASNMKVTDCGCFGDFIKLEPKTSFFKDVFLMIPAIYFLMKHKDMYQLFSEKVRNIVSTATLVLTFVYCISNFVWNLPQVDFRPFYKGADIRTQLNKEREALANVRIESWKLQNLDSKETIELPNDVYMKQYANYPKTEWKVIDQIQSKPTVKQTKVSDFEMSNQEGSDITEDFLNDPEYHLLIVSYKFKGIGTPTIEVIQDSIFSMDTIMVDGIATDSIIKVFDRLEDREQTVMKYEWDAGFAENYKKLKPFLKSAQGQGIKTHIVVGGADPDMIGGFESNFNLGARYLTADDILLKTLLRSNPGIMLWKDGKIVDKWHINKLPSFESVANHYLKN